MLKIFGLVGASGGDAEPEGKIVHGVVDHPGILRYIISHTSNMCFYNMISVKIRLFSVGFDPYLIFSILGQVVQGGYM